MDFSGWVNKWNRDYKAEDFKRRYPEPEPLSACGCGHPGAMPPCSWCTRETDENNEE